MDNADAGLTDNLDQLLGWFISVYRGAESGSDRTSSVLFDQFACYGSGELFGAAFKTRSSVDRVGVQGLWQSKDAWRAYSSHSDASLNRTHVELVSQRMIADPYVIQHTDARGGSLGFGHSGPFSSYYNLSGSRSLSLAYDVLEPIDSERVHFRIILYGIAGCMASSCSDLKSQELFYSFNFVLQTKGPGIIAVGLQGDDVQAPFVFTNWQGAAHNRVLDLDHITGVAFELTMDPQGEIGSTATGSLSFGPSSVSNKEAQNNVTQECQEGEIISVKYIPNHFRTIHHEQNCCERCLADDECFFAFSTGVLYYLAPYVGPGIVGVKNDILSDFRVFAVSSPDKFCGTCDCIKEMGLIDCRGRDLATLPLTLGDDGEGWVPRVLDLRDNPKLAYIGRRMLLPLGEHLEEIYLPQTIDFISEDAMTSLPNLSVLRSDNESVGNHRCAFENAIIGGTGMFGNVCCGKGSSMALAPPLYSLTFCSITSNDPGVDAEFVPFVNYRDADLNNVLRPSSPSMSEASKSPQFCAEQCFLTPGCRYFSFDQRITEAEHSCRLLSNTGTQADTCCCKQEHYADSNQTVPGYVSGWPAVTRHENGARVKLSTTTLQATATNGYKAQYEVSLGAMSSRGAVWVTPTAGSTTTLAVSIFPQTFALYDNTTRIAVVVSVPNGNERTETIVLVNAVESCDTAFSSSQNDISHLNTFLHVDASPTAQSTSRKESIKVMVPSLLGGIATLLAIVLAVKMMRMRGLRKKRDVDPNLRPVSAVLVSEERAFSRRASTSAIVALPIEAFQSPAASAADVDDDDDYYDDGTGQQPKQDRGSSVQQRTVSPRSRGLQFKDQVGGMGVLPSYLLNQPDDAVRVGTDNHDAKRDTALVEVEDHGRNSQGHVSISTLTAPHERDIEHQTTQPGLGAGVDSKEQASEDVDFEARAARSFEDRSQELEHEVEHDTEVGSDSTSEQLQAEERRQS